MTLTGGLTAALVFGYLTHRMGMSSIVGYLLAGITVGGHTPGIVADHSIAEQFAEIGSVEIVWCPIDFLPERAAIGCNYAESLFYRRSLLQKQTYPGSMAV